MSNYIIKTQSIKASGQVALKVLSHEVDDDEARDPFSVITSLFRSAALLPEGEFLGWQLSVDYKNHENKASTFAFSSKGAKVTAKDFNWIFEDYAINMDGHEAVHTSNSPDCFGRKNRKIYVFLFREADGGKKDYDFWPDHMQCCCKELAKMLAELGGIIRVLAESDGNGTASGEILLSLPDEMTLRMCSVLAAVFPGTIAEKLDREADLQDRERRLSTTYIAESMAGVMRAIRPESEDIEYEPIETCGPDGSIDLDELDDEDGVDFMDLPDDVCEDYTPIDDMDLSVRAYNCLKRAHIDSVEQLQKLSDDELLQVRNLGRKAFEEVRQKLAAFLGQEVPVFPKSTTDCSARLEELIGLKDVKEQIRKIKALARMKCDMAKRGEKSVPIALNMEFVGNPGTAKTTVARIVAGIFHEIGLLSGKEVVEVGRADLVAKYVGQTADKVKSAFRKAKGSILFIDEAYSLVDSQENSFGDEAIHTIVQEMENNREDTVVIFAGYPDKMEKFFLRNPGLRSRVTFQIGFPDYSVDEMVQIAEMEAHKRGFAIKEQGREKVKGICETAAKHSEAGNGRFCRNLVESAVLAYALRVYGDDGEGGGEELALAAEDFEIPDLLQEKKKTAPIGFRV